jgi:F-type H+-transporting ATPase subunit delta
VRDETVARNYAETLVEVAERHEGLEVFGDGLEVVARLIDENPSFRVFLETPRIAAGQKKKVIRTVFSDSLPATLINFLLVTIDKRRQRLVREIAEEYHDLVDERLNRVRVEVTLARKMDDASLAELQTRLSALIGRDAIPQVRVKPSILGGVVVRAGDTIYDGSLRRRLDGLRRRLLSTDLPTGGEA